MSDAALAFDTAARSHVGRVRKLNEDRVLARPDIGLWAVADGMGGHQAGDLASRMVVEALDAIDPLGSGYAFLEEVQDSVQRVNRALVAHARLAGAGTVIGSTIVSLLAYAGHFACLWAGDSRAYLIRDGAMEQITRDHSMVQELIDSGALARGDARHYGRSNVITRAVGVSDRLALDIATGPVVAGDLFLLCSDGLTTMLDDHEILARLDEADLDLVADALIEATLERGAKDNVSLVLARADVSGSSTIPTRAG